MPNTKISFYDLRGNLFDKDLILLIIIIIFMLHKFKDQNSWSSWTLAIYYFDRLVELQFLILSKQKYFLQIMQMPFWRRHAMQQKNEIKKEREILLRIKNFDDYCF
jgi:hypothetical protein